MFAKKCNSFCCLSALRAFFFFLDNSTKRLFEVVIDDLDEVLSQAVDKHEREEAFSNDGLDEILSQSLDMFQEVKNSVEDATDITDMFEFGGPGVEGYYTNHSLRATAVSRLFQNDVDDKLIKGVIDLMLYRATKEKLKSNF